MKRFACFFLIALVLSSAVAALGAEVARLKVQEGLSRFLGVPVRVRRLTFSTNRLTLQGVSVPSPASAPLQIERLRLEGSLWSVATGKIFSGDLEKVRSITLTGLSLSVAGVPLQAEGRVYLRASPRSYAQVDGLLTLDHPLLRGSVEVTGPLLEPVVFGWLEPVRIGRHHFLAKLGIHRQAIQLQQIQIQGGWSAAGGLVFRQPSWKGDLIVVGPEDRFKLRVEPAVAGAVRAVLWAQREGMVPQEFTAQWVVRKGRLELQAGLLGNQGVLTGQASLHFPYPAEATLNLDGLDLSELTDWIPNQSDSGLSGKVDGSISIAGSMDRMLSTGDLIAGRGKFGRMDFDQITIRFKGDGPILRIRNSQLKRRDGTMLMEGMVNLQRIGQQDFFRLVKLTPAADSGGVKLGNLSVGAASVDGVKVQAAITPDQNLKLQMQKDEQVIAVEHRKKF